MEFDIKRYLGPNAAQHFLSTLQQDLNKYIMPLIEKDVEMVWDNDAQQKFSAATHCHICSKELNRNSQTIVKDHCHFTGKFNFFILEIICYALSNHIFNIKYFNIIHYFLVITNVKYLKYK